ncbi:hypothetical protein G7Y89_g10777 [Cudoniella acicularis]|uniref:Uncharacterized protein n=1 Tax=Cudoniella acicularis TaxID=354080 RepID=A0A8H4W0L8_9HELO|nr:hypothetical protein G7Y89_g10777 [Cudoniella acicularis]
MDQYYDPHSHFQRRPVHPIQYDYPNMSVQADMQNGTHGTQQAIDAQHIQYMMQVGPMVIGSGNQTGLETVPPGAWLGSHNSAGPIPTSAGLANSTPYSYWPHVDPQPCSTGNGSQPATQVTHPNMNMAMNTTYQNQIQNFGLKQSWEQSSLATSTSSPGTGQHIMSPQRPMHAPTAPWEPEPVSDAASTHATNNLDPSAEHSHLPPTREALSARAQSPTGPTPSPTPSSSSTPCPSQSPLALASEGDSRADDNVSTASTLVCPRCTDNENLKSILDEALARIGATFQTGQDAVVSRHMVKVQEMVKNVTNQVQEEVRNIVASQIQELTRKFEEQREELAKVRNDLQSLSDSHRISSEETKMRDENMSESFSKFTDRFDDHMEFLEGLEEPLTLPPARSRSRSHRQGLGSFRGQRRS